MRFGVNHGQNEESTGGRNVHSAHVDAENHGRENPTIGSHEIGHGYGDQEAFTRI